MSEDHFFDVPEKHSLQKIKIIKKYFETWSNIMVGNLKKYGGNRIGYFDLFSGRGRYKDGTKATPLEVLESTIKNEKLHEHLTSHFIEENSNHFSVLKNEISSLPRINTLYYPPKVYNQEVNEEITEMFEEIDTIPSLIFIDPYGYKGLSLRLVNSVIKSWGCDCIFFFNYNRISPAILNESVQVHMKKLFGETRAEQLKEKLNSTTKDQKENVILEELKKALTEDTKANFVLSYGFKDEKGSRTTHHLIFATKNLLAHDIMKDIMASESSSNVNGVASFEYSPRPIAQLSFLIPNPLDELEERLLSKFKGRTLVMKEIFEKDNVGTNYISKNYKDVLIKLEANGKIITEPPVNKRPKRKGQITFGDKVNVTFP